MSHLVASMNIPEMERVPSAAVAECDPGGKQPNDPGAKLDSGKNRIGLVLSGFARAITAVARVGTYGAEKYSDNGWTQVAAGKQRYTDAMWRHLLREAEGEHLDTESGLPHAAHAAWNALARLDLELRQPEQCECAHEERCNQCDYLSASLVVALERLEDVRARQLNHLSADLRSALSITIDRLRRDVRDHNAKQG